MFTFHVGRLCGGDRGLLFRWFGRSESERFRVCLSAGRGGEPMSADVQAVLGATDLLEAKIEEALRDHGRETVWLLAHADRGLVGEIAALLVADGVTFAEHESFDERDLPPHLSVALAKIR